MKMRDRMKTAGPLWNAMYKRFDDLIKGHNELVEIVLGGQNPHKTNDVTNITALGAAVVIDEIVDLVQDLITKYEAHIGSSTYHLAADSTNTVTELGVPMEVYTLLDEIKVDYEAHRVLTGGSVHSGTDAVNTVTAVNATTKALAVLLSNDIRTQFIANFANVSTHHGASDTAGVAAATAVDVLDGDSSWEEIAGAADELRAAYEDHRVLTAGAVHGAADSTNTVTAAAVGTFATAVYAGVNELKGDFNAHIFEMGTSHRFADDSTEVTATNASSTATAKTLVNELRSEYLDHISRAPEVAVGPVVATLDEE